MFLRSFFIFVACFSVNAMNIADAYAYVPCYLTESRSKMPNPRVDCATLEEVRKSDVHSSTIRQTIKKSVEPHQTEPVNYKKLEEGTQTILIWGPYGELIGVYEDSPRSQENISELEKLQKSLKTDMIFYNSHAIANTILLGGAFYYSPEISAVSGLYMGCCAIVYAAFSINSNIKCAESQNSTEQNVLSTLFYFQRRQSCLNMLATASFMEGEFLEVPVLGYTLGGLALVAAVGNSLFFGCAS